MYFKEVDVLVFVVNLGVGLNVRVKCSGPKDLNEVSILVHLINIKFTILAVNVANSRISSSMFS